MYGDPKCLLCCAGLRSCLLLVNFVNLRSSKRLNIVSTTKNKLLTYGNPFHSFQWSVILHVPLKVVSDCVAVILKFPNISSTLYS